MEPHWQSENEAQAFAAKIHELWKENTTEGRFLRQYARPLNNALALASQVVGETSVKQDHRAWVPNVVIKGKLFHKMPYSLLPPHGQIPRFAQIYVYNPQDDEGDETDIRLGHMRLQSGTTTATKRKLFLLLTKLQEWLRKCNPYVQDCIQVCEIPTEVENMQLVIDPTVRRGQDHSGVYNQATGLKEVQVLMADSPPEKEHCIVIRKRRENGSLQFISDIHRSFDSLYYLLLFPEGEDSWYAGMQSSLSNMQNTPSKQLSVRDFYAYHLHQRNDERETLFRSSRLFQ